MKATNGKATSGKATNGKTMTGHPMNRQQAQTAQEPIRNCFRQLLMIAAVVAMIPSALARSTDVTLTAGESLNLPAAPGTGVAGLGTPVHRIPGVEEITAIRVLDTYRLSFRVNRSANYLVQFAPACTMLPYARNIAMSTTAGTIEAGFDSVAADGQECRINRIYRL